MNLKQLVTRKSKAQEKALKLREEIWPKLDPELLWDRKKNHGFTTVPRTMPILMNIIDSLSKNYPAGHAYFVLWCRAFDQTMIVIENPLTIAAETGFSGERAVTTWKKRMDTLKQLGFIDNHEGPSGAYHYVLLLNPHKIVWKIKSQIQDGLFRQLYSRALDIGATDIERTEEAATAPTATGETTSTKTSEKRVGTKKVK